MSRASDLEAARLAAERTDARCDAIQIAVASKQGDVVLADFAQQMLAEATYIAQQRKSGWKSRSDAHTAAGRILEQWARDLAAYLERDKPPMRPPLETIKSPDRHAGLDPADGSISAQITSGLLSQATADRLIEQATRLESDAQKLIDSGASVTDLVQIVRPDGSSAVELTGPVTPDVARAIREAKTVDDKLDIAFGPLRDERELINETGLNRVFGVPRETVLGEALAPAMQTTEDKVFMERTIAPAQEFEPDPTGPMTGVSEIYLWPDTPNAEPIVMTPDSQTDSPVTIDWNAKGEATVSIPQFVEPGAPPPLQTQQRMTFAQVREHGMARARGADHRSYSQAQAFAECGVKYALSDRDTPAWWNVGGTALHYACEFINRDAYAMQQRGTVPPNTVYDFETLWTNCLNRATSETIAENPTIGPDRWRAAKKGSEGYDWWRTNGVDMVRRWVARLTWLYDQGWRVAEFNGTPAIEYDCPMWIGNGTVVKVENIIDLAMTRDDGTLLIIDAKSGASAPDDTAQLGQYAHALSQLLTGNTTLSMSQVRILGAYWLARTDMLTPVDVTKSDTATDLRELHPWDGIEYLITTMDAAERQGLYLPNKTKSDRFGCGSCGVAGLCPVGPR